jgi:hypothetical protein
LKMKTELLGWIGLPTASYLLTFCAVFFWQDSFIPLDWSKLPSCYLSLGSLWCLPTGLLSSCPLPSIQNITHGELCLRHQVIKIPSHILLPMCLTLKSLSSYSVVSFSLSFVFSSVTLYIYQWKHPAKSCPRPPYCHLCLCSMSLLTMASCFISIHALKDFAVYSLSV